MAEKFNLAALLGDVPNINTERKQIEYIEISKLHPDSRNIYGLSDIDGLMANIEFVGLQQPLEVRPHDEIPGEYTISSGHRRHAALTRLIADGKDDLKEVPCIVISDAGSSALQELRLIYANSSTRVLNPAELSKQAERVEALLYELKEQGVEFPGRMRDHVAQACKVSKSKLARLHAIRSHLIPELLEQFDSFELIESAAYELQKLPEEAQKEIYTAASKKRNYSFKQLRGDCAARCAEYSDKYMEDAKCGDGAECDHHLPRFVYTALSQYGYEYCDGGCCLECYRRRDCKQACKKAKAQQKVEAEQAATEKEKEARADAKRQVKYKEQSQKNALKLLALCEAADLKDSDKIPGATYLISTVKDLRRHAAGDFGSTKLYSAYKYDPYNMEELAKRAKALNCSADYLLELINEPNPVPKINTAAPEWQSGVPGNGKYFCKVNFDGALMRQILIYNNGWKLLSGGHPLDDACEVEGWWPLPEE